MSSGDDNPHWERLAASGDTERLARELELWRTGFAASLVQWRATAPAEFGETAQQLLDDLAALQPAGMASSWEQSREVVASLNQDGHLLREEYLQQLGPTPLACLNSVVQQVASLSNHFAAGAAILADLRALEDWGQANGVHGGAYQQLRDWVENLALGLLSQRAPSAAEARQQVVRLWEALSEEHAAQAREEALAGPTGSARWNSWLLLLELCEHETQDHAPVLDTLDSLDADVEDIFTRLGEEPEVADMVADYRDASDKLRHALSAGKRLKGWSQVLQNVLVDLDALVPRGGAEDAAPVSYARSLCQQFEAGALEVEEFQARLREFSSSLSESRKQSRIQTAQHPSEAAFVEALGKMQAGLDVLLAVERAGQASRLEMGCTLIEEGLAQVEKLEAVDG